MILDALKAKKSSHSREASPQLDREARVHNNLKLLDSCFRRNDKKGRIVLFAKPSIFKIIKQRGTGWN
ncbi:hypothetical protein DRH13_06515 [Candidatus Woesebacteria bacterium]|nr:MAG: hypothetical protein DRH13_06515 [Candidatus Woesebacteria bacterium]